MLILCNLKTRESIFLASNFSSDNFFVPIIYEKLLYWPITEFMDNFHT